MVLEVSKGRYLPAVLRERPFALLFGGQLASTLGDWLFFVALPFGALALGASAGELGLVLAAQSVPFALLALVGGAWADRLDRRTVMLASDLVRAGVQGLMAALLLSGTAQLWHLGALAAVYGVADAFFQPALSGLVPAAAGADRAQDANALLATTRSGTQLIGAPLGGVLVAGLGAGEAIAIDAATFLVSALCLSRMPRLRGERPDAPEPTLRAIATGWRAVRERAWLARFLPVLFVYSVAVLPCIFVLGPLIAQRELGGAASWGLIQGAFAAGAVAGAVLVMRWRPANPMRAVGCAFVICSLQAAVIAVGHSTAAVAALLGLAGIAVGFGWTMWETSVQRGVPEHVLSRVIAFDFTVSAGSLPLGMVVVGPLAEAVGLRPTMIGASALGVALALAYTLSAR